MTRTDSDNFELTVVDHNDGTFSFEWDENDPVMQILNDWTHDDFVQAIMMGLEDAAIIEVEEKIQREQEELQ